MILLKNCFHVAAFDDAGSEWKGCDILLKGGVIERIAPSVELTAEENVKAEILDCSKHLVIPGMVNTHHHFYQTLTRNLPGAQNAKLFDWLVHLYPIWARIDAEGVFQSTQLAAAELLRTGATASTDHLYLYPRGFVGDMVELQFEAATRVGMRFCPTRGCMTRGKSAGGLPPDHVVQTPDEVLADMERAVDRFHDPSPLSMRRVILAPCSPFSVEASVMVETAKLARSKGVLLHTHLVETLDEEEYTLKMHGVRPLRLMEEWGWTGPDIFYAHGIHFNDEELEVLRKSGTGVAHCPTSNMRLGSGIARVAEMLRMGIRVGLAVDGSASNDSSDMLGEVRNALLLQRVRYGADALTARDALRVATRGGAALLGLERCGQIREGYAADLALFDLSGPAYAGALSDPVAALVFCGYDHRTDMTIVNGKVVVRGGRVLDLDEEALTARCHAISRRMVSEGA